MFVVLVTEDGTCSFHIKHVQAPDGEAMGSRQSGDIVDTEWKCPHETHGDTEFCLFHLPLEQREKHDISSETVTEAFLDSVKQGGRVSKEFVGATFRKLDLNHQIIDADDHVPIDLRGASVEMLRIDDTVISQPIVATGVSIGTCSIEKSTLRAACTFTDARFEDAASFRETAFQDTLILEEAVFDSDVEFAEARIDGQMSLSGARFDGDSDFQDCKWDSDVSFESALFNGSARFDGAEFHGGANVITDDADFSAARFADDVSFERVQCRFGNFIGAQFDDTATFEQATFDQGGTFVDAVFGDTVTFDRVTFAADVDFRGSTFCDGVQLAEATFDADAIFRDVVFEGPVNLAGSSFRGGSRLLEDDADFSGSRFEGDLDCHLAEFRFAEFDEVVFSGDVNFRRTEFVRGAHFQATTFASAADFYRARFEGRTMFSGSQFDGETIFDEVTFLDDATFDGVRMADDATFYGAQFRGGAKETDDADFSGVLFEGTVTFDEADFRYACFDHATFDAIGSFDQADFERGAQFKNIESSLVLSFEQAEFDGKVQFTEAEVADLEFSEAVFDDDVLFHRSHVGGDAAFHGAEFNGGTRYVDDAGFEETVFEGTLDFGETEFRDANFTGAEFCSPVTLTDATFTAGVTFDGTTFGGALTCLHAQFEDETSFEDCQMSGPATFDESIFESDVSFARLNADDEITFVGVEFKGGANDRVDDARFVDATFNEKADFSASRFRQGNFDDAVFTGPAIFRDVNFSLAISFDGTQIAERLDCTDSSFPETLYFAPEALDDLAVVDMSCASIEGGRIVETGPVYYDLTEARIGDVRLEQTEPSINVFDRFLFLNTDFDDFDFSLHRDYLSQNEWHIHDVEFDGDQSLEQFDLVAPPDQLEITYLKARNSAQSTGDNKAASEFFILENIYRRQQYVEMIQNQGLGSPWDSFKAGWRWFNNYFFGLTCGHGERPSRVVMASVTIVLGFSLVYWAQGINLSDDGYLRILVYSVEGFTSLVLGSPESSSTLTNLMTATEGFVGAFFIALFVFTLTRSMNR